MAADIWVESQQGPMPDLCLPCLQGACPHPTEFFNVIQDGALYGPFACGCLCDPLSIEERVNPPDGAP